MVHTICNQILCNDLPADYSSVKGFGIVQTISYGANRFLKATTNILFNDIRTLMRLLPIKFRVIDMEINNEIFTIKK